MEIFAILWNIGIAIFWICIALEVVKALNRMIILQDNILKHLQQIAGSLDKDN